MAEEAVAVAAGVRGAEEEEETVGDGRSGILVSPLSLLLSSRIRTSRCLPTSLVGHHDIHESLDPDDDNDDSGAVVVVVVVVEMREDVSVYPLLRSPLTQRCDPRVRGTRQQRQESPLSSVTWPPHEEARVSVPCPLSRCRWAGRERSGGRSVSCFVVWCVSERDREQDTHTHRCTHRETGETRAHAPSLLSFSAPSAPACCPPPPPLLLFPVPSLLILAHM